jgi:hypothetical protein
MYFLVFLRFSSLVLDIALYHLFIPVFPYAPHIIPPFLFDVGEGYSGVIPQFLNVPYDIGSAVVRTKTG